MSNALDRYEDGMGFGLLLGNVTAAESLIGALLSQAAVIAKHGSCDSHGIMVNRTRALAAQAAKLAAVLDEAAGALPATLRKAA